MNAYNFSNWSIEEYAQNLLDGFDEAAGMSPEQKDTVVKAACRKLQDDNGFLELLDSYIGPVLKEGFKVRRLL